MEVVKVFDDPYYNVKANENFILFFQQSNEVCIWDGSLKRRRIFNLSDVCFFGEKIIVSRYDNNILVLDTNLDTIQELDNKYRSVWGNDTYLVITHKEYIKIYDSEFKLRLKIKARTIYSCNFFDNMIIITTDKNLYNITDFKLIRKIESSELFNVIYNYVLYGRFCYDYRNDKIEEYDFDFHYRIENYFYEVRRDALVIKDFRDIIVHEGTINYSQKNLFLCRRNETDIYDLEGNFIRSIKTRLFRVVNKVDFCYVNGDELNYVSEYEHYKFHIPEIYNIIERSNKLLFFSKEGIFLLNFLMPPK